jgi:hypothetical protein
MRGLLAAASARCAPHAAGQITLTLAPDGRVTRVEVGASLGSARSCFTAALREGRVPAFRGAEATIAAKVEAR